MEKVQKPSNLRGPHVFVTVDDNDNEQPDAVSA
jgi:hypothetical protein